MVLLGITHDDTLADTVYLTQKLLKIRLWNENEGIKEEGEEEEEKTGKPWMKSVMDLKYELM